MRSLQCIHRQWRQLTSLQQFWQARSASSIPVSRDPFYARITDEDIGVFRNILGDAGVITDSSALEPLNL
jgi:hypothetical protein